MFGFPKKNRDEISKFKRNYLKTVVIQIKIPKNELVSKKREAIFDIFKSSYPRIKDKMEGGFEIKFGNEHTPVIQPIVESNDGYELRTEDGQKIILISSDTISLTIAGKAYENFDAFLSSDMILIENVFRLLEVKNVNRIAVRKINIIDYTIPEESSLSPMGVLAMVVHEDLLNNYKRLPHQEHIWQNMHNVNYRNGNSQLNLRYGLIASNLPKTGQVVIDIDLFNLDDNLVEKTKEILNSINDEVFNVFAWSICSEALNQLFES